MRARLLVAVVLAGLCVAASAEFVDWQSYDGWGHNIAHPTWGAAGQHLSRRAPPAYGDGTQSPAGASRPSPRLISHSLLGSSPGMGSVRNLTAWVTYFGQAVTQEIVDAQTPACPPEYFNIPVPTCDHVRDPTCSGKKGMPFKRTAYDKSTGSGPGNPRAQINGISSWIDGGFIYGPNKVWADQLRAWEGGRLAASDEDGLLPARNDIGLPMANPPPSFQGTPQDVRRFFRIGAPRANVVPAMLAQSIIWFREHNRRADALAQAHPEWGDEELFQAARQWVIALQQHITVDEWLPLYAGAALPAYSGYDADVHPGVTHVFQTSAMRIGHSMVTPGVWLRRPQCEFTLVPEAASTCPHITMRTCNSYWNSPDILESVDVADIARGLASQITEATDHLFVDDLNEFLFGPMPFPRRDLVATNIQRGRDHGVPDYNTVREVFGLPRVESFADITSDVGLQQRLEDVYGGVDDIDVFVGGLVESHEAGNTGPLFQAALLDVFRRIRDGDRWWYANRGNQGSTLTDADIAAVDATSWGDVVARTTGADAEELQSNVFVWREGDPCPQPEQMRVLDLEACTTPQPVDPFAASTGHIEALLLPYGFVCLIGFGTLWLVAYRRHTRAYMRARAQREAARTHKNGGGASSGGLPSPSATTFRVTELNPRKVSLHHRLRGWVKKIRGIREEEKMPRVLSVRGASLVVCGVSEHDGSLFVLREIPADRIDKLIVAPSSGHVLVRVPSSYDVLVQCDHGVVQEGLENAVREMCGGELASEVSGTAEVLRFAKTKRMRDKELKRFITVAFRTAAGVYGDAAADGEDGAVDVSTLKSAVSKRKRKAMDAVLDRDDFARVLGCRSDSLFLDRMFAVADRDHDGLVTFRDFLFFLVSLSSSDPQKRLRLMFDMYDVEGVGYITEERFLAMLESSMAMNNVQESGGSELPDLVHSMLAPVCDEQGHVSFEAFCRLVNAGDDTAGGGTAHTVNLKRVFNASLTDAVTRKPGSAKKKLGGIVRRKTASDTSSSSSSSHAAASAPTKIHAQAVQTEPTLSMWARVHRYVRKRQLRIFWIFIFVMMNIVIFAERAVTFASQSEHRGLRAIAGQGVTITRGAASAIMFNLALSLLPVCHTLLSRLRDSPVRSMVPFDDSVAFHKLVGVTTLFFTLVHVIGHVVNFYSVSTQSFGDAMCLFPNLTFTNTNPPTFAGFWLFGTLTGVTGVLLLVLCAVLYVFSYPSIRRQWFKWFWITHHLYVPIFAATFLHGSAMLVQPPFFHFFALPTVILFAIHKVISASQAKRPSRVLEAHMLPSDVTHLVIERPKRFVYKSGQYVRMCVPAISSYDFHPFTITSAPHEEYLSLHIRAVGPWTTRLRDVYMPHNHVTTGAALPHVVIDGPYGAGHQEWRDYETIVMIAGGIGVTPFASVLSDLLHQARTRSSRVKHIHFVWSCSTQRQFEWFRDIMKALEEEDRDHALDMHMFITQARDQYDVRSMMLWITEQHAMQTSGTSLFTGLRSRVHFGRMDATNVLRSVKEQHTGEVGVFVCAPPAMTEVVQDAAARLSDSHKAASGVSFRVIAQNF